MTEVISLEDILVTRYALKYFENKENDNLSTLPLPETLRNKIQNLVSDLQNITDIHLNRLSKIMNIIERQVLVIFGDDKEFSEIIMKMIGNGTPNNLKEYIKFLNGSSEYNNDYQILAVNLNEFFKLVNGNISFAYKKMNTENNLSSGNNISSMRNHISAICKERSLKSINQL